MVEILKPEYRLLLDSIRFPLLPEEIEGMRRDILPELDWQVFTALIERHQVGSLVYFHFNKHASDLVPPRVMKGLKTRQENNSQTMMALSVELAGLARCLAAQGIGVCPLKGIYLSQQVYGSLSLRDVGDIDILVRHACLDQADQELLARGYRRTDPAFQLTPVQKKVYEQFRHHYGYIGPNHWTPVELHWQIGSSYEMPPAITTQMLDRSQKVNFLGVPFLSLTREDTLAFMIFHGSQHGWSRLKWLADMAAFLRQDLPLAWEQVFATIERMGMRRSFIQSFRLARHLLGSSIPEPVQNLIARLPPDDDLDDFWSSSLLAAQDLSMNSGSLFRFRIGLYAIRSTPGFCEKLRRLSAYRFFPEDWQQFPLPDRLFWLYSILRPIFWLYRQLFPPKKNNAHSAG